MRSIYPLTAILVIALNFVFAQAPNKMNYQAVVRNSSGQPVANGTAVNLRFTIHDGSATGTALFNEVISTTANQFGLVNVEIGSSNNLGIVDWGAGARYLQVEADINNTGSYVDLGATQLVSVPYALYAANSNVGPAGPMGPTGPAGATGGDGLQGPAGATGAAGPQGVTGPQGPSGADGAQGPAGVTGPTGPQGPSGNDGAAGAAGATGPAGAAGATGAQGATGPQGDTGPQGATGPTGSVSTAPDFDTGWVPITANTTYTYNHNLNVEPNRVEVRFKDAAGRINGWGNPGWYDQGSVSGWHGIKRDDSYLTNTQIFIRIHNVSFGSSTYGAYNQMRVMIWK